MFVEVIDTFRNLLPLGDDVKADDTLTQPIKALPNRLYVWPIRSGPQQPADEPAGRVPDPLFRVAVLYTVAAKGETRTPFGRDRDISEALDAALENLLAAIYTNRRSDLWWDAWHESIAFDAVRNDAARGHGINVVLRLNNPIGGE